MSKENLKIDNKCFKLEEINNPEIQHQFEFSFIVAELVFTHIGLKSPTPEEFFKAGVDFDYLANEYKRMELENLEPKLVIAPLLPLSKELTPDSEENWKSLYAYLTDDKTIQNNPLRSKELGMMGLTKGFMICEILSIPEIKQDIFEQELNLVKNNPNIHKVISNNILWTISLLSATKEPQCLGLPNLDSYAEVNNSKISRHTAISQYLTLQATRVQTNQQPLDRYFFTILNGVIEESSCNYESPLEGYWNSDIGIIIVGAQKTGIHGKKGIRIPVWG